MTDEEFRAKVSTELSDIASCMRVLAAAEHKKTHPNPLKMPDIIVMLLIGGCIFAALSKAGDVFAICSLAILVYSLLKATIFWLYRRFFSHSEEDI